MDQKSKSSTQAAGDAKKEGVEPDYVLKAMELGPFQTNTYLLGCGRTKKGVVIDPGFEADLVLSKIEDLGLDIEQILLTHGHVDHVGAVAPVAEATGAKVAIHSADVEIYLAAPKMGMFFGVRSDPPPKPDRLFQDGEKIGVGDLTLSVIHTPGHSPGGVSFLCEEIGVLFCGDTLFCRGIGRTDLPGGSFSELSRSIRRKLYTLDGGLKVLSGHGPPTTLREEMLMNPFVTL